METTFQEMLKQEQKKMKGMQRQPPTLTTSLQPTNQQTEQMRTYLVAMNPSRQGEVAKHPYDCIFGQHPELTSLANTYGDNAPVAWLIPQIKDLSEFCGCKEKLSMEQLAGCAQVIAMSYGYLKTSELMLFFHLFKSGRYGQFYGAIDPLKITTALHKFLNDRNDYFYRIEENRRDKERMKARIGAVSYEKYQEMLKNGEIPDKPPTGDSDAR